jgi:DNA polymerase III epsilon subunit-like protein
MIQMRELVIDTETTGFDPTKGHRVVEIGAVELVDHSPTGRTRRRLDTFINPQIYTFWGNQRPSIMTMTTALAE